MTLAVMRPLYSGSAGGCRWCGTGNPLVRQRQPLQQLLGGFVRRGTVKRHHGGWHARTTAQLRPPPVADAGYLNLIKATADSFFKMMNCHVCDVPFEESRARSILFADIVRSSEARREARVHMHGSGGSLESRHEINFAVRFSTAFAPVVHRISTNAGSVEMVPDLYNTGSPL